MVRGSDACAKLLVDKPRSSLALENLKAHQMHVVQCAVDVIVDCAAYLRHSHICIYIYAQCTSDATAWRVGCNHLANSGVVCLSVYLLALLHVQVFDTCDTNIHTYVYVPALHGASSNWLAMQLRVH